MKIPLESKSNEIKQIAIKKELKLVKSVYFLRFQPATIMYIKFNETYSHIFGLKITQNIITDIICRIMKLFKMNLQQNCVKNRLGS